MHDYLNGPAANVPFSKTFAFANGSAGPTPSPDRRARLERTCGPEQGMPYPMPLEATALASSSVATYVIDATGVVNGARLATVCV